MIALVGALEGALGGALEGALEGERWELWMGALVGALGERYLYGRFV